MLYRCPAWCLEILQVYEFIINGIGTIGPESRYRNPGTAVSTKRNSRKRSTNTERFLTTIVGLSPRDKESD